MARHNREGKGEDQHGRAYLVNYQPDWLRQIKVTRHLENGRQSTKTLLRNPQPSTADPGSRIRTHVEAPELGLNFELTLSDPRRSVRRIIVETVVPGGEEQGQVVSLVMSSIPDDD
ncbi:MAG: hypothetical protein M3P24_03195 [Gemmatimonadota bacterium]|nr:hypothetical protein [Gemmatimonadota bacterium]